MKNSKKNLFFLSMFLIILSQIYIFAQAGRETWQPPEKIMNAIGVKPGMIIGEPGAGSGYFTFPLAKRVGKNGRVYANDISSRALKMIKSRAEREGILNIKTVMGEIADPLFPVKKLDMIIMVYVLHMLEKPLPFMENVKKYMGPDTPLVIIEKDTRHERAHPPSFMTRREILETIQKTNYKLVKTETFLPKDTIYIFKLKEGN